MSVEKKIIKELDGVLGCIRNAEQNIIGMDCSDKLKVVEKLVDLETAISDIKSDITIPDFEVTKDTEIDELRDEELLSIRACNCLKRAGCVNIRDILNRSPDEVLYMRNMGRKSYDEIAKFLLEHNFASWHVSAELLKEDNKL